MIKIINFIPVDPNKHKSILLGLNSEYLSWIAKNLKEEYNLDLFSILGKSLEEYSEASLEDLVSYKPPQNLLST
ncbi:MAG: hypothetical protein ACFE8J_15275 [Candidatus Heimdallarchaeota archaeon]